MWLISKWAFSFISKPIEDLSGSYRERKCIAAEMATSIATAGGNLKLVKLEAEAKRLANQKGNDADYDLQVLKNRRELLMDQTIITVFLGFFISFYTTAAAVYGKWLAGYGL
ncbi:hypothetical protein AKG98_719 [Moritella sp. JT01]|uniref:hypothetical protein n=1 Tax=Moritella sp. JT01 TaxID=756698 RepID=UPI00079A757D|nr:hypothetical protein [Moritella sp. JT01]KXO10877.1 hypothetical protein AKG98_719 [Moritella sp. JT01]